MTTNSDRPLRVAIWAAVSTPEQAQIDKDSLPAQERDGRAWADLKGAEVVRVYSVPGHSRKYLFFEDAAAAMEAYRELRADVEAGTFDVLWTRHRDRLGRTMGLIATVDGLVRSGGAEVYSAAMPHSIGHSSSTSATILTAVEASLAEAENAERTRRFAMGMRARVSKRGLIGTMYPMGYTPVREGGAAIGYVLSEYADAVQMMTRFFLDGLSYAEIVRRMNDSPWRPPGGGDSWHPSTIRRTMQNDVYAGLPTHGSTTYDGEPQYPALWDEATYHAILRERRRRESAPANHPTGNPYAEIVSCARCGGPMQMIGRYYRCGRHATKRVGGAPCHCNTTSRRKVTAALVDYFTRLQTPEQVALLLEEYGDTDDGARLRGEMREHEQAIEDWHDKRKRLADALAAGHLDGALYRERDDSYLEEIARHQARVVELGRQIDAVPDLAAWHAELSNLAAHFPEYVAELPPETVAKLLQDAGVKVWCEDRQVVRVEP